ncbi:uncharacterized protein LOC111696273 isoform X1 [Eurytemora carolleeae]|uniref:uncharacterized protein LOC111696273 isoform X1 n=1 Tax=Eurytemora carolleeae TaxID=1294199 RepID=UPI000C783384|nr:uncharacterized protein LOC111696273 isoform X1 [Eurytemora carolleeae]|eukprot:XP_023321597.1 uncharacterized protein LOC111696273 isoform X1 [Eurytemora affinis]
MNTKPRVHSSLTNTSISGSPQWTSGSGTIKEIRLYELEHKTRRLEKENANLKLREEFYINKGSEWKGRAKRYEAILDENEIKYRKRSDDSKSEPAAATSAVKENVKPNELDDLDLGLNQERPRREYRLPADQRKRKENDCKTQ